MVKKQNQERRFIMKRNTLFTALFALMSLMAAANPFFSSKLQINVLEGGLYEFEVNGQYIQTSNRSLYLEQLAPGVYNVRIYRTIHNNNGHHFQRPPNRVLVFQDDLFLNANTVMVGKLDRFGMQFRSSSIRPTGRKYEYQHPRNESTICEPIGRRSNRDNQLIINAYQHQNLLHALHDATFDNSKLQIAKTALRNNRMSTEQIASIVREFSFDSYRLEVAKFAFDYCADPQNYYLLSNEFTFDSTTRKLLEYIQ